MKPKRVETLRLLRRKELSDAARNLGDLTAILGAIQSKIAHANELLDQKRKELGCKYEPGGVVSAQKLQMVYMLREVRQKAIEAENARLDALWDEERQAKESVEFARLKVVSARRRLDAVKA